MAEFNERMLSLLSGSNALVEGEELENLDCVYAFSAVRKKDDEDEWALHMSATVDDGEEESQVYADLDWSSKELTHVYCDCWDFEMREGLCRHCVAMFFHFFKHEQAYWQGATGNSRSGSRIQPKSKPKRKTESGMQRLLEKYGQKERLKLQDTSDAPVGRVKLEPTIHINGNFKVSLRIGMEKMYIVKDIYSLVSDVKNIENHSYGKNLTFVHRLEAFDEESRPLMEFFLRHFDPDVFWYRVTEKEVSLSNALFDELMETAGKNGIVLDIPRKKISGIWTMTDEPLKQEIVIVGSDEGAELSYDVAYNLQTSNYNYYLQNNLIYRESRKGLPVKEELQEYLYSKTGTQPFISEEDLPLFVRELLPVLEQHFQVTTRDIDLQKYMPEEAEFKIYLDLEQDDMITCDLVSVYADGKSYHVFAGIPQQGNRNVPQEMQMQNFVSSYCNAMDAERHLAVAGGDDACMFRLLTEGIPRFREVAEVFVSDRLKRLTQIRQPKVTVGVSLSGDLLELTLNSEGMSLEQLAEVLSKYDRKKKFFRLKSGEFFSTEDANLDTLSQVKKGLMLTDKQLEKGAVSLPKFRALYLDSQLKESEGIPVNKSRDFKALIRAMHTVEDSDYEVPETLAGVLREYQKNGYRWMETLCANGFCGILADDMGLGKTLQAITFLVAHFEREKGKPLKALIVCPASLIYNWENECRRFAPDLPVLAVAGNAAERKMQVLGLPERIVLITSYDLLKRDQEYYEKIRFDYEFIDEAQFIKNSNTKAAQSVKMIVSSFRMALTGTPVENRLSELWSIFDYLMPGYLYSYQKFRSEIETPIVQNGDSDAMARLQKMISPFVLRRVKKDVLKDLPDKLERDMVARMSGEQKDLYEAHVQRLLMVLDKQSPEEFDRSKIQILSELTKLRQLCCDPGLIYENYQGGSAKLDLCIELVHNAIESGHKMLIYSQFTTMLDRIAASLDENHIPFYMLTGATSKKQRMQMVNAFNENDVPVFCISLKAGGTGLNLTGADIVIHYDPWWNTAAQNQATDRTHRIGQKNTVMVYRLIAKDSIEENIVRLQERKQQLADQVLGGEGVGKPTFSREELMELLSHID